MNLKEIRDLGDKEAFKADYEGDPEFSVLEPDSILVGSFETYEVYSAVDFNSSWNELSITFNKEVIGRVSIGQATYQNFDGFVVESIFLDKEYRGQGIGLSFYEWLLKEKGIVFSDNAQSPSSKAVWKKIARKYPVYLIRNASFSSNDTRGRLTISRRPVKRTDVAYDDVNKAAILMASIRPVETKKITESPIVDVSYHTDRDGSEGSFKRDTQKIRSEKWRSVLIGNWQSRFKFALHFLETDYDTYMAGIIDQEYPDDSLGSKTPDDARKKGLGVSTLQRGVETDEEKLKDNFGYVPREDAINVIYAGNSTTDELVDKGLVHFLSPWMLAHRIAHSYDTWSQLIYKSNAYSKLRTVIRKYDNRNDNGNCIARALKLYADIKSIKNGSTWLTEEFEAEMFASYVVLNKIKLKPDTPEEIVAIFKAFEKIIKQTLSEYIGKTLYI